MWPLLHLFAAAFCPLLRNYFPELIPPLQLNVTDTPPSNFELENFSINQTIHFSYHFHLNHVVDILHVG